MFNFQKIAVKYCKNTARARTHARQMLTNKVADRRKTISNDEIRVYQLLSLKLALYNEAIVGPVSTAHPKQCPEVRGS